MSLLSHSIIQTLLWFENIFPSLFAKWQMMILQGSSLHLGSELDMRKNVHACSCSHDYETAIGSLCIIAV